MAQRTEALEQATLFSWVRLQANAIPELALLHHIPNGGLRSKIVAAKLKAQGVKPGVFDLFLPVARCGFHGLYIEMKVGKASLSDAQSDFAAKCMEQNYCMCVCYSFEEAKDTLLSYLRDSVPTGGLITLH